MVFNIGKKVVLQAEKPRGKVTIRPGFGNEVKMFIDSSKTVSQIPSGKWGVVLRDGTVLRTASTKKQAIRKAQGVARKLRKKGFKPVIKK